MAPASSSTSRPAPASGDSSTRPQERDLEILDALRRTRDLVALSEDSDWSTRPAHKIEARLDALIRIVEAGRKPGIRLGFLFLPTGDLQEISMANGWGEEFLDLADVVDRYLRS